MEKDVTAVFNRYTQEADLTIFEAVATLELVKARILEDWHDKHRLRDYER